ncbi:DUF2281 domain-containing protein [Tumidithrix elongata RA019]|uniref:DUF2281 domain-containing protein n=1 Tax=Tumidithrix elongata BACA0141 TaxID=2716417 RepID=A0AAW9PTM9_9CYAN|nr:DUF2281 domain-containing protein [Tumidithrix elongata RA019]
MNTVEVRQKIDRNLNRLPPEKLALIADFIEFLSLKESDSLQDASRRESVPEKAIANLDKPSTGASILEHLKKIGSWHGDDFEECLQMVYATRSKAKFDKHINPFE